MTHATLATMANLSAPAPVRAIGWRRGVPVKRELASEPDLETLASWDADDNIPTATLPLLVSATELYRGQIVSLRKKWAPRAHFSKWGNVVLDRIAPVSDRAAAGFEVRAAGREASGSSGRSH